MFRFILSRFLQSLLALFLVITATFFMIRFVPGGPFTQEKAVTPEILRNLEAHYGLDQPLGVQYVNFLKTLVTGTQPSIRHATRTVGEIIRESFPISLELGCWALLIALGLGLPAGMLAAQRPNSFQDYGPMSAAMVGVGLPTFVLGPLLVLFFALKLGWFHTSGWSTPGDRVLPAFTLGCHLAAYIARLTRGGMLEVMGQDFIRTARAKGAPERRVLVRHALRNALGPVIALCGLLLPSLVGGAVFVEAIFAWPGMGRTMVDAVTGRDYPLAIGIVMVSSVLVTLGGLCADLAAAMADPRVSAGRR